jgi:ssDNA-binding Zn-finger/Zn-ribbon topoisomerase 1
MNNIYDRLTKIRIKDKKELKKHIAGIKEKVENKSHICPKCGSALVSKQGKYGAFIGCSGYPKCRYIYKGDNLN